LLALVLSLWLEVFFFHWGSFIPGKDVAIIF
jgi:hypothetical protein